MLDDIKLHTLSVFMDLYMVCTNPSAVNSAHSLITPKGFGSQTAAESEGAVKDA